MANVQELEITNEPFDSPSTILYLYELSQVPLLTHSDELFTGRRESLINTYLGSLPCDYYDNHTAINGVKLTSLIFFSYGAHMKYGPSSLIASTLTKTW